MARFSGEAVVHFQDEGWTVHPLLVVRDVRAVHRSTPNLTDVPRPMVVIGYSRRWYFRPEVQIRIPQGEWDKLSPLGRGLLRHNPVVPDDALVQGEETYRSFAY